MPANTSNLAPGGGPNSPSGLIGPTYFGEVSSTTDSSIIPSLTVSSELSLGFYRSAASTLALSYGTMSLPSVLTVGGAATFSAAAAINGVLSVNTFSMQTYAAGSGMTTGQVILIFNASGLSLGYSSGKSMYFFGGSTVSAVQN